MGLVLAEQPKRRRMQHYLCFFYYQLSHENKSMIYAIIALLISGFGPATMCYQCKLVFQLIYSVSKAIDLLVLITFKYAWVPSIRALYVNLIDNNQIIHICFVSFSNGNRNSFSCKIIQQENNVLSMRSNRAH